MTETILHTRTFGDLVFSLRGPYVYLHGRQVCDKGRLFGDTLMATPTSLDHVAKTWWRAHKRTCGCHEHGVSCFRR